MYPAYNPTPSNYQQQKKKHRNPFTYLFAKQHKSTPTSGEFIQEEQKQG
jgi:hypothetical protein